MDFPTIAELVSRNPLFSEILTPISQPIFSKFTTVALHGIGTGGHFLLRRCQQYAATALHAIPARSERLRALRATRVAHEQKCSISLVSPGCARGGLPREGGTGVGNESEEVAEL